MRATLYVCLVRADFGIILYRINRDAYIDACTYVAINYAQYLTR